VGRTACPGISQSVSACIGTGGARRLESRRDIPALPFCHVVLRQELKAAGYPIVLNHLGDHLLKRRLDLGLNQKQAARVLGCHATSVANWESRRREPEIWQLPRLIKFLGYDPRPKAEDIGGWLRRHRTAQGLSCESAAHQIGIDAGTLARWEKGQRQPEGKYLMKVYAFLGEDPRPVPTTIAERITRQREALGLSQRELARRIGVYPSTIERWELGQRRPSPEHVSKMESLLDSAAPDRL